MYSPIPEFTYKELVTLVSYLLPLCTVVLSTKVMTANISYHTLFSSHCTNLATF